MKKSPKHKKHMKSKPRSVMSKLSVPAKWQPKRTVVLAVSFAVIGALVVLATRAATNTASFQAESGLCVGNVSCESGDSSASGDGYVKFGQQAYKDLFVNNSSSCSTCSDSNNGNTEALAVKTIKTAVQKATDYTRIRIKSGTYVETIRIQKNNLKIEPYGDGEVTINGAIPEFINGVSWTKVQTGIYKYDLGRDEYSSQGNTIYGGDGKQQWSYDDLGELKAKKTVNNLSGVFINNNFFNLFGGIGVYVATNTGQPPSAPLYIGSNESTIDISNADNIIINGLSNSKLNVVYGNYNIKAKNSNNIKIANVNVTGGQSGIDITDSSNVLIKDNKVRGTFDRDWDWADVKEYSQSTMENQGIHIKTNTRDMSNVNTEGNEVSGYFNSVNYSRDYPPSGTPYYTSNYTVDNSVISNNILHDSIDDGIEIDGRYNNLVVKGNKVYDTYSPFSATGAKNGNVYVYENLFVADRVISDRHGAIRIGPSYALKMNGEGEPVENKNMYLYHNTFYFAGNSNHRRTIESLPTSVTKNVSFTNNIFYSTEGGILRGTGKASDNIKYNGNVFYSPVSDPDPDNANFYAWNSYYDNLNSYPSLSAIISGGKLPGGWVGNAEGNPGFNCVIPTNASCFKPSAGITLSSRQTIDGAFAESDRLNNRTRIGAFE